MGTVFLAEDLSLHREVAVKFLLPELANSKECSARFRNEAIGMAAIRDNNVAQIYSYGTHGGIPYFVMEHLDGQTVEGIIDAHNRRGFFIPIADAVEMLVQATSGLAAIHRAGAVHRDIKPANIMLSGDNSRAVIMDFGLMRNVRMEDQTRTLAGTPAYMAPELIEGRPEADRSPLTDVYSLGAAAYEILTGSLPFGGETWVEILRKHITETPSFPSERRAGLPTEIDEIVFRALSKDPKERYQSCEELLEEFLLVEQLSFPDDTQISLSPEGQPTRGRRSSQRLRSRPLKAIRSTPSAGRARLLVADRDSEFRTQVHGAIKAAVPGCRIYSATDGAMALSLFEEYAPHAVVFNLSMPEVNGFELAATIRGDERGRDAMMIVVADQASRREAQLFKGLRINHFLTKPVDTEALIDMLRGTLERPLALPRRITNTPH
jgi:eukaryotic-like serine/threonine-protein kinase